MVSQHFLVEHKPTGRPCSGPFSFAWLNSLSRPRATFCTLPANAQALTGNVTTVLRGGGFLTLYPSNATQPTVANSNYTANEVVNNVFTVGLGADGAFKIFALNTTDVVVDVTGYYAPPGTGGLFFHPLPTPVRLLETRTGQAVGCFKPGAPAAPPQLALAARPPPQPLVPARPRTVSATPGKHPATCATCTPTRQTQPPLQTPRTSLCTHAPAFRATRPLIRAPASAFCAPHTPIPAPHTPIPARAASLRTTRQPIRTGAAPTQTTTQSVGAMPPRVFSVRPRTAGPRMRPSLPRRSPTETPPVSSAALIAAAVVSRPAPALTR